MSGRRWWSGAHAVALVIAVGAAALAVGGPARAGGPPAVATIDRGLWPEVIASRKAFDRASRAEILVFAHELELAAAGEGAGGAGAAPGRGGAGGAGDSGGRARWLGEMRPLLAENLRRARASCGGPAELGCDGAAPTAATLAACARAFVEHVPGDVEPWLAAARAFHRTYAAEQLRLASLFPRITSEVLTFDARERNGREMADGDFLITFDDGPTAAGGKTDETLRVVRELGLGATFFVLGDNLARRRKAAGDPAVRALYDGQCLASHGRVHSSHQKLPDWRASIEGTRDAVREIAAPAPGPGGAAAAARAPVFFRPPYGQRTREIAAWALGAGSPIMLWNIDSQDWNGRMSAGAIPDRIVTLMALWRRGIVLFHDIHPKAARALPEIVRVGRAAGLRFVDCHAR